MKNAEQLQPDAVKEKAGELWNNRRKFLSRSFIGTAGIFMGAASVTRGATELTLNHSKDILKSPTLIPQIPEHLDEIPKAIQAVAGEVREHAGKIAATRIDLNATCYVNGEKDHTKRFLIDTPYTDDIDWACATTREESFRKAELKKEREDQGTTDSTSRSSDGTAIFRTGIGAAMAGAGIMIAKGRDSEGRLNRREIFKRAKSGAIGGVVWHYLDIRS